MAGNVSWDNVPSHMIKIIGQKMIGSCEDYIRFSSVCKSWQSVTSEMREDGLTFMLSPESPLLLLAEKVPEGSLLGCDIGVDEDGYEEENNSMDNMDEDDENEEDYEYENHEEMGELFDGEDDEDDVDQEDNGDNEMEDEYGYKEGEQEQDEEEGYEDKEVIREEDSGEEGCEDEDQKKGDDEDLKELEEYEGFEEDENKLVTKYDQLIISVGTARGIYSLSTGKIFVVELPEAAGKLILGTNKGWLLTIGKDSEANLLHPLLRQQISLPSIYFAHKVAMSLTTQCLKENLLENDIFDPTIMIIHGKGGDLGFSRFGDKVWTKVFITSIGPFVDIAFHKGLFYAVHCTGNIFVCHYTEGGRVIGTKIERCPFKPNDFDSMYLVDSGVDLWFLARIRRIKFFKSPHKMKVKYRTTNFFIWKLEQNVSKDGHEKFTWNQKNDLGDKAFFIGRNSSISLSSSWCIRPNCIYFTDDAFEMYYPYGGGHDMGVFNVESRTIEPYFQGKSIHPISPPLWCI